MSPCEPRADELLRGHRQTCWTVHRAHRRSVFHRAAHDDCRLLLGSPAAHPDPGADDPSRG